MLFYHTLVIHDFRRISLWLLTRQFDKLWNDPALLGMLKRHCAICGEAVSLQYIAVHLRLEHQLGPNDLHLIVMQLCRIFTTEHSEEPYCDHCGDLLPTLDVLEFDPVPEMHLPGCPLILHLAAFLMHPILHKSSYDPVAWPTPQAIEAAFLKNSSAYCSMFHPQTQLVGNLMPWSLVVYRSCKMNWFCIPSIIAVLFVTKPFTCLVPWQNI